MIDVSKYGTPIQENDGFVNKTDVSKYGTPATPAPQTAIPEKTGVGGVKGFLLGGLKSAVQGTTDTASMLQGLGQRSLAALTPMSLNQVRSNTGLAGLDPNTPEGKAQAEMLKRNGKAEKYGGYAETVAEILVPSLMASKQYKASKTLDYLKNTPETLSTLEEKVASLAGRVKQTLGGVKKILPSKTELRAAEILEGQLSGNVTKNPTIIDKEISKRGQEAENFLAKNAKKISAKEQADAFANARKLMSDFATKAELKAYDELKNIFTKRIVGKGGFTTDNFYRALKEFEQNVTRNLPKGKAALIGDNLGLGSARVRAAQDIRTVVRDLIGLKHPEFKPKMFDIASLYDVLDTALTKSRQLSGSTVSRIIKNNPTLSKLIGGATVLGGGYLLGKGNQKPNLSDVNSLGN